MIYFKEMNNISLAEALAVIDNYHPCIYEDNHITDDKATNIAIERMLWKWQDDLIILREFYWRN